jgi:hypothetical protein
MPHDSFGINIILTKEEPKGISVLLSKRNHEVTILSLLNTKRQLYSHTAIVAEPRPHPGQVSV